MVNRSGTRLSLLCVLVFVALAFAASAGLAGTDMKKQETGSVPAFEKMKSLVGEWKGKAADGTPATVTYTLVSDNSALMERLAAGGEPEMVTMYYPDGSHLMLTHYCSAHNQPRMRSDGNLLEGKKIAFAFVDITNLSSPDAGYMKGLVLTFEDKDHLTQNWTWREKGKEGTHSFQFARQK